MGYGDYFKGKRVTVMRIGLLGRGVGDAAFLAEAGADVHVVDDAPQEVMQPSVDALSEYPNIRFTFGPYQLEHFTDCDLVLVGAGTPLRSPQLAAAREAGVPLKQSAALFAEVSGIPIIAVTGTRGKSTVTHLIHHVLRVVTGEEVILGGNIRGVSNLQLLKKVKEDSLAVMELDSWQLQGWGWAGISPQVAVFTNFMEDHMNYYLQASEQSDRAGSGIFERAPEASSAYEAAMDAYFADKANIFINQSESGILVTTPEVWERAEAFARGRNITLGQEVALVDVSILPDDLLLSIPGAHNRLNAALAYRALSALNLSDEEIFEAMASFPGVEGRLQYIGEIEGVRVYNDNNATTPAATIAGLEALGDEAEKNIVLIAGGAYKEVDPAPMLSVIDRYTKYVALLAGTGTDLIADELGADVFDSISAAVEASLERAEAGDILLFSPGFASFGMFKNEYERNDEFMKIIKSYADQ